MPKVTSKMGNADKNQAIFSTAIALNLFSRWLLPKNLNWYQILPMAEVLGKWETEAVFNKTEMNKKWSINFLQSNPLGFEHTYSTSVPLVEVPFF